MRDGCAECGKKLKEGIYTTVIYDKCRGKTCPDCGKERKLGTIETLDLGEASTFKCLKCGRMKRHFVSRFGKKDEGVCGNCFLEREGKNGCICFDTKPFLLCPICDEVHTQPALCEKCLKNKTVSYQRKQTFLKVVLPTFLVSILLGLVVGWFLAKKFSSRENKINKQG
jgi:hypothetical protein